MMFFSSMPMLASGDPIKSVPPMAPGDQAPLGTGETVCPNCGGSGRLASNVCPMCQGTGKINVGVGGGRAGEGGLNRSAGRWHHGPPICC